MRDGILEPLLDAHEEGHGLLAVDEPVIIGERDVHHRTDHDLTVHRHRPLLDLVHAEDAGLGRIQDRRREQRAEDAAVGDGEGAAGEIVGHQLAVARAGRELGRSARSSSARRMRVGVADDGHDEARARVLTAMPRCTWRW